MVKAVRESEKLKGTISYYLTEKQISARDFSRSLYIVKDVKKGDLVTEKNVKSIRPGFGMHPKYLKNIIGKSFSDDFKKGMGLSENMIK